MNSSEYEFWGVVLAAIALFVSNIFVIIQIWQTNQRLKSSNKQMQVNYELSLRNRSLSYSLYATSHVRDARIKIEKYMRDEIKAGKPMTMQKLEEYSKVDSDIKSHVLTILAHWENLALAIHSEVADEEVAYEMVAGTLVQHVTVFGDFIKDRQMTNRNAYKHLLRLQDSWEKKLSPPITPKAPILPINASTRLKG